MAPPVLPGEGEGEDKGSHAHMYIHMYIQERTIYILHTLNHAIARCTQTISYPEAQIQQDNGH